MFQPIQNSIGKRSTIVSVNNFTLWCDPFILGLVNFPLTHTIQLSELLGSYGRILSFISLFTLFDEYDLIFYALKYRETNYYQIRNRFIQLYHVHHHSKHQYHNTRLKYLVEVHHFEKNMSNPDFQVRKSNFALWTKHRL